MKRIYRFDFILAATIAILIFLGILALTSVSVFFSQEKFGFPTYYLSRQIFLGLIPGIILGFVAFKFPLSKLKKLAPVLFFLSLILMVLVFLPKIGSSFGGASRWVNLGPFSFQPSEFLKLTFILYLAAWLSSRVEKNKEKEGFNQTLIPFLIILGIIALLLIFQPDISTLGVIVMVGAIMYFLAGTPILHSVFIFSIIGIGLFSLIKIAPYRMARLLAFLSPEIDPMGLSYQIKQALIAIGSGGILGKGLGMSIQKLGYLPQPMSDSIFAIFSEETGFLGGFILIFLFLIFLWRGFEISKKAEDKFSQLVALGICSWIVIQAFVNMGSMVGILPLTGIPLPFLSYGGSALVAELIGIGILLNISKQKF